MAKEVKKKTKNQVVEIHIYVHQVPNYQPQTGVTYPQYPPNWPITTC